MAKKIVKVIIGLVTIMLLTFGGKTIMDAVAVDSVPNEVSTKSDIPSVIIDNEGIKSNADAWNSFVRDSKNGKVSSIRIQYQYDMSKIYDKSPIAADMADMKQPDVYLEFDGERYSAKPSKEKYKYLLQLTGRSYKAACDDTCVILSNEKYSYQDVNKSMYSSNSNDHIPYTLLFSTLVPKVN